jgi:type I restriction enzyme S subunit
LFFRPNLKKINPQYLYWVLSNSNTKAFLEGEAKGSTMSNLNLNIVRNIPFPLPSLEEQKKIVKQVEQLFVFADKIEARYTKAKIMLDKLPQSILAKAFRGELVAQDPNDEPASVLLERIKLEKEKLAAEKKGKKTKKYSIEETPVKIAAEKGVKYKKAKI